MSKNNCEANCECSKGSSFFSMFSKLLGTKKKQEFKESLADKEYWTNQLNKLQINKEQALEIMENCGCHCHKSYGAILHVVDCCKLSCEKIDSLKKLDI